MSFAKPARQSVSVAGPPPIRSGRIRRSFIIGWIAIVGAVVAASALAVGPLSHASASVTVAAVESQTVNSGG